MAKANTKAANGNTEAALNDAAPANKGPETIAAPAAQERAPITISTKSAETKSSKAVAVFNECYANYHTDPKSVPARKDIIARLVKEAGLTMNGAATYLQNMKTKAGIVQKKA